KGIRLSNKFKSERIELPYKDTKLNGWLLLPNGAPKDVPVVLIIPGWTGFKEEMYSAYATHLIERGTAVCLIDGPGQGESLYFDHCFQEIEMERAYRVVLEFLKCHTELGEIGILGSSFGGYLCLRTAAYSADLITACVSKGGSSYPLEITTSVPYYMDKILVRWGKDTSEAEYMRTEVLPHMNLKGLGKKVTCPILFIHNEEDRLFDVNGIKQFYDEVSSKDKSLVVYPGKVHNAIEQDTEARCLLIDWFQEKLSNGGKL
ncbi:alpha/beta hydrolase family protein, partial [Paenibacillus graminis]